METHNGEKTMLADVNFETNFKVSKYFVDVDNLDKIIPKVENFKENDLLFVDEIGQMQLFSEKFKQLILKCLDSSNSCIATLSKVYSDKFIDEIKNRNDIIIVEIDEQSRDIKEEYIKALLKKIAKAKRYFSEPSRFTINVDETTIITDHGIRKLIKQNNNRVCSCDFCKENNICSHIIALEEYLKINSPIKLDK